MKFPPRRISGSLALGAAAMLSVFSSLYGGGYGSTQDQIAQNRNKIFALHQQVSRMQEEIDGLKSIIESLSQRLNDLSREQKSAGTETAVENRLDQIESRIRKLESRRSAPAGKKTAASTRKNPASKKKPGRGSVDSALEKAASDKLFSRGVRLINQKKYSEAQKRFTILLKRNYKPASSNFYMGEIAYRSGRNDEAIKYYQKSAELNENAAYMDRLLLHTGLALEKSGDKEQARNFFRAIVDGYPGTASARVAKKHLK